MWSHTSKKQWATEWTLRYTTKFTNISTTQVQFLDQRMDWYYHDEHVEVIRVQETLGATLIHAPHKVGITLQYRRQWMKVLTEEWEREIREISYWRFIDPRVELNSFLSKTGNATKNTQSQDIFRIHLICTFPSMVILHRQENKVTLMWKDCHHLLIPALSSLRCWVFVFRVLHKSTTYQQNTSTPQSDRR